MAQQPAENLFHLMGLHIGGDFGPLTFYKSKRGRLVWFNKAPPLTPPSAKQTTQRNQFRLAALFWTQLDEDQRQQWELASRRASLCMNGYDLFVHFATKPDQARQETIARQTSTVLT